MAFTEEEKAAYFAEKRVREFREPPEPFRQEPIATCIHCSRPFALDEGNITEDVAICYICND